MNTAFILILMALVLSALFSGLEIAFVSAHPLKLEILRRRADLAGRIIGYFRDRQARFIGTMVVGNNIVLVLYGILMSEALTPALNRIAGHLPWTLDTWFITLLQTAFSSAIILVLAEFLPKAVFAANAVGFVKALALPAYLFYWILYPVASVLIWLSEATLRLAGKPGNQDKPFTLKDLSYLVEQDNKSAQTQDDDTRQEIRILRNALAFRNAKARECMVPRNDVVAVEIQTPMPEVIGLFARTGFSKLPVYEGTIDRIMGYVHSYSVFSSPASLHECLKPVLIVPESRPIRAILTELLAQRISMAVVVDEFGGTAGILTTEDVIEEIFGHIEDEHDQPETKEVQLDDHTFLFSGRLEIDYLNDRYGLNLPEGDDYTTLAGFVLSLAGTIPGEGEQIIHDPYILTVRKVHNGRLEEIELRISE
jgi:CBS domain containing-hemolysin-like protein